MLNLKNINQWFTMYPPSCTDSKGWRSFDEQCKENFPIRYWLNETLIPNTWDVVIRFLKEIRNQIRYRFFEKLHIISTKLPYGYHDTDYRMLYGMFSLLVDFVEIELAWMQLISSKDYKRPWYHVKRFRNKEFGIEYLNWEIELRDENKSQSESAEEIKKLYFWWMTIRPNRPDPYDLMDIPEFQSKGNKLYDWLDNDSNSIRKKEIFEQITILENQYNDEDTEMLTRLIKLRGSLWT